MDKTTNEKNDKDCIDKIKNKSIKKKENQLCA